MVLLKERHAGRPDFHPGAWRRRTAIRLTALAMAIGVPLCDPARGQQIDYGAFQSMFGEPVSAWVTGIPQRASDVAANITIITADEIRQSGSRSIPQVLSRVPGLDIFQDSLNSFDVGVRGYQTAFQPRLLVLIDGRQVFVDDYSRTIWDNLPVNIDDIRQIEIVKGAASALSGPNAAGGVINIVTYSPLYDDSNVASLTAGNLHQLTSDATATMRGTWGGAKISAGGLTADAFDTPIAPGDAIPLPPRHTYVAASAIFQVTPDLQLTAEANYSASRASTADPTDFGTIGNQYTTTSSIGFGGNWQSPIGLLSNNTYYNHTVVQLFETTSGGDGTNGGLPYTFHTDLLVSQFQDQFKIGADHTVRITLEYRYKAFTNDGVQLVAQQPGIAQGGVAAGGAWVWRINDRWSWTNAARLDHTELTQTGHIFSDAYFGPAAYNQKVNAFSANSGLIFTASSVDSLRIGYDRGVQLPSLLNLGWDITQNFGSNGIADYEANPALKPTTVEDYSIDYDRKIDSLMSHLKLSIYYEFNRNITAAAVGTNANVLLNGVPAPVVLTENVGNSAGWGTEIQLKGNSPSGFRWDLSYSYARVTDIGAVKSTVDYQGSSPQHHVRVLLGYTLDKWEFDMNAQAVTGTNMLRSLDGGSTQSTFLVRGYTSLSGRIGYRITDHLTAALSGTNLSQAVTQESPYPAIQRLILATLQVKF